MVLRAQKGQSGVYMLRQIERGKSFMDDRLNEL